MQTRQGIVRGAVTNTNSFKKLSHEPTLRYNFSMYGAEP